MKVLLILFSFLFFTSGICQDPSETISFIDVRHTAILQPQYPDEEKLEGWRVLFNEVHHRLACCLSNEDKRVQTTQYKEGGAIRFLVNEKGKVMEVIVDRVATKEIQRDVEEVMYSLEQDFTWPDGLDSSTPFWLEMPLHVLPPPRATRCYFGGPFTFAEQMPEYIPGLKVLQQELHCTTLKQLDFPEDFTEEDYLILRFVVAPSGTVDYSKVMILKTPSEEVSKAAVFALQEINHDFIPAFQAGKPVDCWFTVKVELEGDGFVF